MAFGLCISPSDVRRDLTVDIPNPRSGLFGSTPKTSPNSGLRGEVSGGIPRSVNDCDASGGPMASFGPWTSG